MKPVLWETACLYCQPVPPSSSLTSESHISHSLISSANILSLTSAVWQPLFSWWRCHTETKVPSLQNICQLVLNCLHRLCLPRQIVNLLMVGTLYVWSLCVQLNIWYMIDFHTHGLLLIANDFILLVMRNGTEHQRSNTAGLRGFGTRCVFFFDLQSAVFVWNFS